jgi:hypothetical protein
MLSPRDSSTRPTAERSCTSSRVSASIVHDCGPPPTGAAASAETGSSAMTRLLVSTIQPSLNRSRPSRSNRAAASTVSPAASVTSGQGRPFPGEAAGGAAVEGVAGRSMVSGRVKT